MNKLLRTAPQALPEVNRSNRVHIMSLGTFARSASPARRLIALGEDTRYKPLHLNF